MSATSPVPIVPLYTAEYTLERPTLFLLCLRLGAPATGLLVLWGVILWLIGVFAAMPEYTWAMFQLVAGYHATWWWGLILLLLGLLPMAAYLRARRQKTVGLPVFYAFDDQGIYASCALFETRILWSCFRSRRELDDFFVLHDGVRQVLWPKDVFPDEAVDRIRELTDFLARK